MGPREVKPSGRLHIGTFWISLFISNSKRLRLLCLLIYDRKEIILPRHQSRLRRDGRDVAPLGVSRVPRALPVELHIPSNAVNKLLIFYGKVNRN
jgi:hypothetical protein